MIVHLSVCISFILKGAITIIYTIIIIINKQTVPTFQLNVVDQQQTGQQPPSL